MPDQSKTLSRHLLGAQECPNVTLNGMDWYQGASPWNKGAFNSTAKGIWAVTIMRSGNYRFECRIYPREADKPLAATSATIRIGDRSETISVDAGAKHATFNLDLPPGDYDLETVLENKAGKQRGALFVYVSSDSSR